MSPIELKIDWATHEAAKFACEKWHYSKILPTGKIVKIGVWENAKFIGVVLFSRGASPHLGTKFNLKQTELCELTRVALTTHIAPVSRIVSIALKFLRKQSPGLRLVVSFADPERGHAGGIYKAGNWLYTGLSGSTVEYYVGGRWRHVRGAYHIVKGKKVATRERKGKHRFLMPLDDETRKMLAPLVRPYAPKAEASMRPSSTREKGGLSPTSALQKERRVRA